MALGGGTVKKNIIKNTLSVLLALIVGLLINPVFAEEDKKIDCRKPRIRSLEPPHLAEIPPETEFTFTLPVWTEPTNVKVTVKKLIPEMVVEDHNSFFLVKVKIPPELRGTFARVDVIAAAKLGCLRKKGWLYKITE